MEKIRTLSQELWYVLTGALAVWSILELIWPGVILAYINMNVVLIFWLINSIILLVIQNNKHG